MARRSIGQKTTPKVRDGRVQKKNRTDESEYIALVDGRSFTVIKHRAKPGYRHVIQLPEVYRFVELIPNWRAASSGLSALALDAHGGEQTDTHYDSGYRAIWMRPFPESMQSVWSSSFYGRHEAFVSRLGVEIVADYGSTISLGWTLAQAKAWQLLHLFLYDLNVHEQFMRSGQRPRSEHCERTGEEVAFSGAERILPAYERELGRIV